MKKKKVTKSSLQVGEAGIKFAEEKGVKIPKYETEEDFEWAENSWSFVPSPSQQMRMEDLIRGSKHLLHCIQMHCPPSRERSLAITKLQEAKMWATKSFVNEKNV